MTIRSSRLLDVREVPSLVPETHLNETARLVEAEMSIRVAKLKEKIDSGALESDDEGPCNCHCCVCEN